jgi:hypothetical protein
LTDEEEATGQALWRVRPKREFIDQSIEYVRTRSFPHIGAVHTSLSISIRSNWVKYGPDAQSKYHALLRIPFDMDTHPMPIRVE